MKMMVCSWVCITFDLTGILSTIKDFFGFEETPSQGMDETFAAPPIFEIPLPIFMTTNLSPKSVRG